MALAHSGSPGMAPAHSGSPGTAPAHSGSPRTAPAHPGSPGTMVVTPLWYVCVHVQGSDQTRSDSVHPYRLDSRRSDSSRLSRLWWQLSAQSLYWLTAPVTVVYFVVDLI